MPSPELTELRSLVARRDALEGMRTQEHNRLHAARAQVRAGIEAHLVFLDKAVKDIDAKIRRNIDSDTALKGQSGLLDSVPGLGVKTIPVLLSSRLAASGKPPMVIICAMMRKLVHVAVGVPNSGKIFNPALHAD